MLSTTTNKINCSENYNVFRVTAVGNGMECVNEFDYLEFVYRDCFSGSK